MNLNDFMQSVPAGELAQFQQVAREALRLSYSQDDPARLCVCVQYLAPLLEAIAGEPQRVHKPAMGYSEFRDGRR